MSADSSQPPSPPSAASGLPRALALLLLFGALPTLPLLGVRHLGLETAPFLEPLPNLQRVTHAPFSWLAFALLALAILAVLTPFAVRLGRYRGPLPAGPTLRPFPFWGWLGLLALALSWTAAWTRLPALASVQAWTFAPLWLSYVVVVSALAARYGGRPALLAPRAWLLWPLGAAFWWLFEYLNRFVESWTYQGADFSRPGSLFWHGILPMATVLPAVVATQDLLARSPRLTAPFREAWRLPTPSHPRLVAALVVLASGIGLCALPLYPNLLFPLLWLAPLSLLLGGRVLFGERPRLLRELACGDWRRAVTFALAALACGFCWELWNSFSQARWTYSIPYVGGVRVFEMPLLGYAGYPPFGLECAAVAGLIGFVGRRSPSEPPLGVVGGEDLEQESEQR
ncbi:MAG: hypothetical protein JKY65_01405 [Planctomycetes bacterium]|nr:hypothetical protein [Planctomycetota bacterium]